MSLRVIEPGLHTLVVDFGRQGCRGLGVPVGGAADRAALAIGNALVGNPPDAAGLEFSMAGPTLLAECALACVVYGAPFALHGDRHPAQGSRVAGKTFTLLPGEKLRIGTTPSGVRAYFCVRGGLQEKVILGSRSSLEPLHEGQELSCLPGQIHARFLAHSFTSARDPQTIRVLPGPQADWFHSEDFYQQEFTVSAASNRMGLRLEGKPLRLAARACVSPGSESGEVQPESVKEMISEPVSPGAVQVTREGQCIILGVDGQTIGGYPKIAHAIHADLDELGQLRPGQRVDFESVSLEEAETLYRKKQADLNEWLIRLRLSLG